MTPQFGLPTERGHITAACAIATVLCTTYTFTRLHLFQDLSWLDLLSYGEYTTPQEAVSTVGSTNNTKYTVKTL
ncbi:hypothetical protein E4T38_06383 [Aureobasidium subglaciale]|nr:hypothetical protein E4T38_06383 [Aureobasidium subglaciale]KAI5219455.1 hypothetical protein E4T40_06365 [Aureobasidium subglaciale]KAI5223249.1 hypothetical protein E4T41_06205 [Aureobasidium subglaciale]KAI5259750.1 hypothetical protein E4T46_06640 [Aureobasidium subglaciale]